MAEAVLRAGLGAGYEVGSAGVAALVGEPADPLAVDVMREHGHDISEHRGRQVVLPMLLNAELILALDRTHSAVLVRQYPHLRGRVHKLLRWRGDADVEDPFRQSKAAFEHAYRDIDLGVQDWVARLQKNRPV